MTPSDEAELLTALLKQLDRSDRNMLQSAWIAPVVWVMTAMAFLVLFQAAEHVHPLALALGSTFVGILLGALGFCTVVARQWPAVRPHISRESVADRLSAIKT